MRKLKKPVSVLLAALLMLALAVPAFAENSNPENPEICNHVCSTESCGFEEAAEENPCTADNDDCNHEDECGFAPAVEESPCTHEHSEDCFVIDEEEQPADEDEEQEEETDEEIDTEADEEDEPADEEPAQAEEADEEVINADEQENENSEEKAPAESPFSFLRSFFSSFSALSLFSTNTAPEDIDTVTAISVNSQPDKLSYVETDDDSLDLEGLAVDLSVTLKSEAGGGTATVTVAYADFSDYGITASPDNGDNLTVANNNTPVTVTHTVSSETATTDNLTVTAQPQVTSISVTSQPAKLSYVETDDDTLDLSGLVVELTYDNSSTQSVAYADFSDYGITASPDNGDNLTVANNNTPVTVTHTVSSETATTDNLTVSAKAEKPNLTALVDGSYEVGDAATALDASASVTDGGTLSYEWFKNTTNSTTGGTPVGTNSNEYTPDTSAVGTSYYYVVVTNTLGQSTATETSTVAEIVVNPTHAQTPVISTQPASTQYALGATANALKVTASVTDGGTLSYQWYSNTSASTSGGTPVGTDSDTYTPDITATGIMFYYVEITNTNSNATQQKTTVLFSTVAEIEVVDEIDHSPIKQPDASTPVSLDEVLEVSFKGVFSNFQEIKLNGTVLSTVPSADGSYLLICWPGKTGAYCGTIREGSVIISLSPAFLETLESGTHTIEAVFNDNTVISSGKISFKVEQKPEEVKPEETTTGGVPATGDETNIVFWAIICIASMFAIIGAVIIFKKKNAIKN